MATNDVNTLMKKVRQSRRYNPDPLTDDQITELLQVARWTGSSRNTQPWHFIAVSDKDKLKALSELRTPINWVAEAPLGIAIVLKGENADVSEAYDEGRVTERLMIAAHAMGLGAGVAWYGDADLQNKAKEILGVPSEMTARSVVVIGDAITSKDPRPNPSQPGRHPLEEVSSRNTMGSQG
jgi:nitroreductase